MFDETSPLVGLHSVSEGDYNIRYRVCVCVCVCALMQIRRLPQTDRRQVDNCIPFFYGFMAQSRKRLGRVIHN